MEKRRKILLLLIGIILGIIIGLASAITIINLAPAYLGFFQQNIQDTRIQVTFISHKILTDQRVQTKIHLHNPTSSDITVNMTIYYRDSAGTTLAHKDYDNLLIRAGQTEKLTYTITLDVSQWVKTDVSITEV